MSAIERPDPAYRHVVALTIALFLSYLTVAMSLSAVSVHVVQNLGLGNTYGGLAVGIAFLSTILTRGWAGGRAATHEGSNTVNHSVAWLGLGVGVAVIAVTNSADPFTGVTGRALDALSSRLVAFHESAR